MSINESNEPENFPPPFINQAVSPIDALPVAPDNPPWNSWAALGVWIASIAFIIISPNIFLLPYLATAHLDFADRAAIVEFAKTDPTAVLLQLAAVIPAHILTLILAWLVVTRFRKYSFRETLGWQWNGFNFWNCLIMLGIFYCLAGAASYISPDQDNDFVRMLQTSRNAVYITAFLATFTAPLIEEVVYRGILYSAFQRSLGATKAILITTFLFAIIHVPQYWGSPTTIFVICVLSLTLTLIRFRTKSLLPCIVLHTLINGSQSVLLLLQPFIQDYIEKHQAQAAALVHLLK